MFIEYKAKHNECQTKSKLLNDMANHCSFWRQMMVSSSITTSCHENSHGVSSDLRNGKRDFDDSFALMSSFATADGRKNGFYVFNDKAIVLDEPSIRKSDAAKFIPTKLRFNRFKTYITGQTAWDDTPLYIVDEFNAYIAGSECAIELGEMGDSSPKGTDISTGPIEFLFYTMGLCLAIQNKDPGYFEREPNFKEFIQYEAQRALEASEKSNEYFPWQDTTKMLELWYGPECDEYRAFLGNDLDIDDFRVI